MATFEKTLEQVRIALRNAMDDPQLLSTLSLYGYGMERLQEGMAYYETANAQLQSQNDANFAKTKTLRSFEKNWETARFYLQSDLKVAQFVLSKDESMDPLLPVNTPNSRNFDKWREHAKSFYLGLRKDPELQAAVASMGLSAERIEIGIERLRALEEERRAIQSQKGNTNDSRKRRSAAFQELHHWMIRFRKIARVAFEAQPGYLSSLGIQPPTQQSKQKKKSVPVLPLASPAANPVAFVNAAQ